MIKTTSYTFDNISLHAIIVPVDCKRMTIREQAQDASPVAYDVTAPTSSDAPYRKYEGETTVFEAQPGTMFLAGSVIGYIQPTAGTVVFSAICE